LPKAFRCGGIIPFSKGKLDCAFVKLQQPAERDAFGSILFIGISILWGKWQSLTRPYAIGESSNSLDT
jgi:hypothetical protein